MMQSRVILQNVMQESPHDAVSNGPFRGGDELHDVIEKIFEKTCLG